jgi:LysM repeat protein
MNDLYKAIDALNEISQAERDAMRAQMDAEKAAVRAAADAEKAAVMKAAGRAPITKADMYKDVADFAKQQRAASKAAGYATKAEYDAAYQQNLDNLAKAGVNMDDVYAAANKMMSTEKGAARLAKMGIQDDDDLISYAMAKAGIKDVTPDKYTATDYAITDIPEDELTFETEESLEERVTYSTLAKLSGIKDPNKIFPGQKITLPGGGSYTVKSGDTLSGIAQNYRLKKIGQPKKDKLDDPTTKIPQVPKSGKLDDPTTKIPQVPNKLGPDGQYDGDDLGNAPTTPDVDPGDFEIARNTDAGDDTDDMLNKYVKIKGDDYKLDPKSVKQPGLPVYRQIDTPASAKTKPSDAELAAQYAKNTNPKLNVKPVVTPSAASADDAIGKSGEKTIQAVKKDIDQSYTKKGVSSLYNRLKDLF